MTEWLPRGPPAALAVLIAFAIDHAFGEPPLHWHPVVWAGRALAATRAPWPHATPGGAFMRGMGVWLVGAVISLGLGAIAWCAIASVARLPREPSFWTIGVQGALLGILLKPLFAWRLLHDEVASVSQALRGSLAEGRVQLRRLVSRDTTLLSATVVRESALESLAENLNDSLVAPLFWFVLGGLPGAALYRFANTADAMWGYHGPWEWAGKWTARADDVLSFVPARLTAALLAVAALRWPRHLRREAARTPSPNGGWPMAALALVLDVRLSKPGVYTLHEAGRSAAAEDLIRGIFIASRAAWCATVLTSGILLVG